VESGGQVLNIEGLWEDFGRTLEGVWKNFVEGEGFYIVSAKFWVGGRGARFRRPCCLAAASSTYSSSF
jgi:hypothetical protein